MPVSLNHLRDQLLPGLLTVCWEYRMQHHVWTDAFTSDVAAPHIWIPKISIPLAVAAGAAATVIRNPEVTRRFWAGWGL